MWVCRNCKDLNDNALNECSKCNTPKDITEHEVVEDYKPDTHIVEGHLTLSKGEVITVLEKGETMWRGKLGREEGLFPKICVTDKIITRQIYRVVKPYFVEHTDHLKVEKDDVVRGINRTSNGLLWVLFQHKAGWIPETYLEKAISDKEPVTTKIASRSIFMNQETRKEKKQVTLQRPCHSKKYEVLYDFKCNDSNLEITEGDIIYIVGREKNGWFLAQIGYEKGLVPVSYVRLLENQKDDIFCVKAIYSGEEIGDLNVQIGDMVKVLNRQNPGWLWVKHNETEGWYPKNHLTHHDNTDESIEVPPPTPASLKSQATPLMTESRELSQTAYRNTEVHDEPKTTNSITDRGAIKIAETEHVYSYTTGSEVRCAEPMSKERRQPAERRFVDISETPMRQSPLTRHPLSKFEDKTRVDNAEGTEMIATLYGIREQNEIRLVMVGKTGSGKSATGNTIMTKANHFVSKLSGGSVTNECKRGECSQAGRKIVVIDTPGLFDTKTPKDQISKEIINCVHMSSPGPHVFLLVVQIARFTDEEIETFNRLFDLFGEEMGRFAIITFTRLDDIERCNTTIESYIDEAPDTMKEFLKRCHGRYIAFDNNASAKNKTAKVKSLIKLVDSIVNKNGGKWYTNEMYQAAEAALQRKIKIVEKEKALEKKKEIERIQSTFVNKIDSMKQENKQLALQVSDKEKLQLQIQREKEKAQQEIQRMKEEMKTIDKERNAELYRMKKKKKEEKEKQANALEEKERYQMKVLQSIQEQQIEMNRKYQEMEQQKELQLSKAAEQHSKIMEAEIQRIVDGNNQKYNEMMKTMDAKDRANEKLQDQIAQQNASMQQFMRESDQRNKELLRQQEENIKQMADEKRKAEETFKMHLEEQKKSMDDKTKAVLQDQMEKDKRQREEFQAATLKANEILQEKMEQQNKMMREREQDFLKQQENQQKLMDAKTEAILQKQRKSDEKQSKEFAELKRQNENMRGKLDKEDGCLLS